MASHDTSSFTSTPLKSNWAFKQGDLSSTNEFLPAHDVPTEVHRDLLKNSEISDPFKESNELSVHWVADETWTYRTTFAAPVNYGKTATVTRLKFEGLDTFATVYLNGEEILNSNNMFVEHSVDLADKLKATGNVLEIEFESASKKGLDLVKEHPEHRFIVHQTDVSRGPVRKAQYHWGWDWGPLLLSCGPWKPILLETFTGEIKDLSVKYVLAANMRSAQVTAIASCIGSLKGVMFTLVNKSTDDNIVSQFAEVLQDAVSVSSTFQLEDLELWWPHGYGSQALYTIRADAHVHKEDPVVLHSLCRTFGFRKVDLIRQSDSIGTSFYFRINDVDIFIGGSCWIPADSFLTRTSNETYRSWVKLAAEGNQNMLRVWGGGIYEADAFFEAADELGIMIWQDFMFACASYPAYPEYLASVEEEARQNVRRLRHHPSLVIWAGNNEDYQLIERYELDYNFENKDPEAWLKTDFPARYIYEYLLPNVIETECPDIPYHPSSPFGNGNSTTLKVDPTVGDVHQWEVWGTMVPYQRLPDMGGRFVSEFGMEAYPHVSTLERCITREEDRQPGSMTMDFRNKAAEHERRLMSYVAGNFRIRYDLEGFTHLTQVMQADAMLWAYKGWRRQWGAPSNRKCGGVLVWQLNDCWPTISWAVVDYHLVPKLAYYAIKRSMKPVTVGVQRKFRPWTMRPADEIWQRDTGHINMHELWHNSTFDVWVGNNTTEELRGEVFIKCYCINNGEIIGTPWKQNVTIASNGTTEILKGHVLVPDRMVTTEQPFNFANVDPYVVQALLYIDGVCVANDTAWPDPIKYLNFSERGLDVQYHNSNSRIVFTATKPIKGFAINEREGVKLSDNGFDLMPTESKEVLVTGCTAKELKWMFIGI